MRSHVSVHQAFLNTPSDDWPAARTFQILKARYKAVEGRTGVPWPFIAVIHEREASQNWNTQLGQGDPLNQASVHIPAGRGPFSTWEEGAYDALMNCAPHAACNKDWSIGGTLTMLEQYNGVGYAARGKPSPYVWAGTDQYVSGKYVRDGVYDSDAVDSQPGCAGLLIGMIALDPSIDFRSDKPAGGGRAAWPIPTDNQLRQEASIWNPADGSIGAFLKSILDAIFRRK